MNPASDPSDLIHQPHYPFEFHLADAFEFPLDGFDAIHASPPCQFATAYKRRPGVAEEAPNLIDDTRHLLMGSETRWVIENVETARPWMEFPIRLCGSSFGLDVRRHRLFESSIPLLERGCDHGWQTPRFPPATNRTNLRSTVEVGSWRCADVAPAAMGIDWMTNEELSQAIPPAFTEWVGTQLLQAISAAA